MPKRETEKPYNDGQWTTARFNSFIKSALRSASTKWPPKWTVLKEARVERGVYLCAGYNRKPHRVKHKDGVAVDHIEPVIPATGFVSWDDVIKRMFVEKSGLQVLCKDCHDLKSKSERKRKSE